MALKLAFNPITAKFDLVQDLTGYLNRDHWRGVSATEPDGVEGDYYINSVDNGYYIYYNGGWSLVATTIPPVTTTGILLESGDYLLLETGDIILKES